MKILVINGPNLNLLGSRAPETYGRDTLESIITELELAGRKRGIDVDSFQSNNEGKLIDKLHEARGIYDGIIINPGAYTHYSYAIRDAIEAIEIPVVEVHLSNIYSREEFRHTSVISSVCRGTIAGLGKKGYFLALDSFV